MSCKAKSHLVLSLHALSEAGGLTAVEQVDHPSFVA